MSGLDRADRDGRESVDCGIRRPLDGLTPVDQVRTRSTDAHLRAGRGTRAHDESGSSEPVRDMNGAALCSHFDDLGEDGRERDREEESEDARVQVPERAAPDERDQGHEDERDDARVDDAFACEGRNATR